MSEAADDWRPDWMEPQVGERRALPDGGAKVYVGGGRWVDQHSPAGRQCIASLNLRSVASDVAATRAPANIEAEQALLGAMLYDAEAVFAVDGIVRPVHFFEPFHQRLCEAIRQRAQKGRATDPALFVQDFEHDPAWPELGGSRYLADLIDKAPPAANAPDYAREVAAMYARRELMRLGRELIELGRTAPTTDPDELLGIAERQLAELAGSTGSADAFTTAADMVREALDYAENRSGVMDYPTGLKAVDTLLGGLNAGETTILAARPGMGKTVAAQKVASTSAAAGKGTCFFSLEMQRKALGLRLASDLAFDRRAVCYSGETTNPTADRAMKGLLSPDQWRQLREAQAIVSRWPLLIDDRAGLTLAQIEAAARRAHRRWARKGIPPGPVIIDHLGKVRPTIDRKGNRHAEVADISGGVAEMAKRLGVPVLALVQLNRGVESREDRRPVLSDLRQAGELEEDARQVVFLYRPEYYLRDATPDETFEQESARLEKLRKVERQLFWIVEKNSHGPRGQALTFCDVACSAIRDWEG